MNNLKFIPPNTDNIVVETEHGKWSISIYDAEKLQFYSEYDTEEEARAGTYDYLFHGSNFSMKKGKNK